MVYPAPTCLCTHVQWVTVGVKRLCQLNGEVEGLASSQDKLIHGNLTGVVFAIVGFNLEVHFHQDWGTNRYEPMFS